MKCIRPLSVTPLVCLLLIALCLSGCGPSDRSDFDLAAKQNTPQAYRDFLQKWPQSQLIAKAQEALRGLDRQAFQKAQAGGAAGLKGYLDRWPQGQFAGQAKEQFDKLLSEEAARQGTAAAYEAAFRQAKTLAGSDRLWAAWDDALFKEAAAQASPDKIQRYLEQFPRGRHAEEARGLLDEQAWQKARAQNTPEAYKQYRGKHRQEAERALEELLWSACQKGRSRQNCQAYLSEFRRGQHVQQAEKYLEALDYQAALKANTMEAWKKFLSRHPRGAHAKQAEAKLRAAWFQQAMSSGSLEDMEGFVLRYTYALTGKAQVEAVARKLEPALFAQIQKAPTLELCDRYLHHFRTKPRGKQVLALREPLLYDWAIKTNTIPAYDNFLKDYPKSARRAEIDRRRESLVFAQAGKTKKVADYEKYLREYPRGRHKDQAAAQLEPLLYQKARQEDWHADYQKYLAQYPQGQFTAEARQRLAWLRSQRAVPAVAYPREVEPSRRSPNLSSPYWSWDMVFKETGGKIGYRVTTQGHILDPKGVKWGYSGGYIRLKEVKVPAGGQAKSNYWLRPGDHRFCNGYAIFIWTGEDAGGHKIGPIQVKVRLKHTGCPGPKK
ncbi:MAG: hypothetical protein AB1814_02930 [Thermodesulfobacteriota bacterium]